MDNCQRCKNRRAGISHISPWEKVSEKCAACDAPILPLPEPLKEEEKKVCHSEPPKESRLEGDPACFDLAG